MSLFPCSSSIFSATHLALWLEDNYPFSKPARCQLIRAGINHHYLVETSTGKYILRVYFYQWRSQDQVQEELAFILRQKAAGQAVAYPIANKAGSYFNVLLAPEGERLVVLFSFAKGAYLPNPSAGVVDQIGKRIADMHTLSKDQFFIHRKTYNTHTLGKWALQEITKRFSTDSPAVQYLQKGQQAIEAAFQQADVEALPKGQIHLDVWYDNMRIDAKQTITLYDFDNCGNGWLFLDLAYTSMIIYFTEPDPIQAQKKIDHFLEGYQSILPISTLERQLIPYGGLAIWIHYLGIQCLRFEDWSNLFLNEGFVENWAKRAERWLAFHQIDLNRA